MKVLADDTRYQMISILLREGRRMCICEFEPYFEKDTSVLYRNIKQLEQAGIITTEKDGRKLYARIAETEAVRNLFDAIDRLEHDLPPTPEPIESQTA